MEGCTAGLRQSLYPCSPRTIYKSEYSCWQRLLSSRTHVPPRNPYRLYLHRNLRGHLRWSEISHDSAPASDGFPSFLQNNSEPFCRPAEDSVFKRRCHCFDHPVEWWLKAGKNIFMSDSGVHASDIARCEGERWKWREVALLTDW